MGGSRARSGERSERTLDAPKRSLKMSGRSDGVLFLFVSSEELSSRSSSLEPVPDVSCCNADSKGFGGSEPARNLERDSRVCGHAVCPTRR